MASRCCNPPQTHHLLLDPRPSIKIQMMMIIIRYAPICSSVQMPNQKWSLTSSKNFFEKIRFIGAGSGKVQGKDTGPWSCRMFFFLILKFHHPNSRNSFIVLVVLRVRGAIKMHLVDAHRNGASCAIRLRSDQHKQQSEKKKKKKLKKTRRQGTRGPRPRRKTKTQNIN